MLVKMAAESTVGFFNKNKSVIAHILIVLIIFGAGVYVGHTYFPEKINVPVVADGISKMPGAINIEGDVKQTTETDFSYVPKKVIMHTIMDRNGNTRQVTEQEKTDLDVDIAKTDFNVKVNGHEATFTKKDDEQYMFDKDKLALKQQSQVEFNVHVDPVIVDKTKHFGIGVGINDKGQPAYIIDVPISKKRDLDGWIYKDDDRKAAGIEVRF